jgi:hypothetical protein
MSPRADFDWQILIEATIVPPAERRPWNEPRPADDLTLPAQPSPTSRDSHREPRLDGDVVLTAGSAGF